MVWEGHVDFLHPAALCFTFSCWTLGIVYSFLLLSIALRRKIVTAGFRQGYLWWFPELRSSSIFWYEIKEKRHILKLCVCFAGWYPALLWFKGTQRVYLYILEQWPWALGFCRAAKTHKQKHWGRTAIWSWRCLVKQSFFYPPTYPHSRRNTF